MNLEGWIFDIKRFAVHDGPGIRTTVFLKGCPLTCMWCHNPESIDPAPQILFFPERCIGCLACISACPNGALSERGEKPHHDQSRCRSCGRCAEACYPGATLLQGRKLSVAEVIEEVEKDRPFYESSGGGMTLSGGEPLMQPEFARELLREAKNARIHTVLDTAAHSPWEVLESMLPFTDLVLLDLKEMDPEKHRRFTGVDNSLILSNAQRMLKARVPFVVRTPIVPAHNDTLENFRTMAEFLAGADSLERVEFLPYHRLGESKYRRLRKPYPLEGLQPPTKETLETLATPLRDARIVVKIA